LDLVLEGQGYRILTASDVTDARQVLDLLDFEAMVVEAQLLNVDREQWRRINATHPGMPVLGISEPHASCGCCS
jgi:DNA-binding response OmpR family regulator